MDKWVVEIFAKNISGKCVKVAEKWKRWDVFSWVVVFLGGQFKLDATDIFVWVNKKVCLEIW